MSSMLYLCLVCYSFVQMRTDVSGKAESFGESETKTNESERETKYKNNHTRSSRILRNFIRQTISVSILRTICSYHPVLYGPTELLVYTVRTLCLETEPVTVVTYSWENRD